MSEAVEKLHGFFESTQAHVGLCVETFPALKPTLLPPLEAWRKRYAKLRENSDALYLDLFRQRYPAISDADLLAMLEAMRTSLVRVLRVTPRALAEQTCAQMPDRFADGTYDPARQYPEADALVNEFKMQ